MHRSCDKDATLNPFGTGPGPARFDHADDEVERIGASGRKGWQAAYATQS
jgi:integrase/recombinase XerD